MNTEAILHQLLKDNWDVAEQIDHFLNIYDKLPKRMRMCVDLKMTGSTNKEVSKIMNISEVTVRRHLQQAKGYFSGFLKERKIYSVEQVYFEVR